MDNLTKILLAKYQPDSPLLQEALQVDTETVTKQALPEPKEIAVVPPEFPQKAVAMSNGRTGVINIVMSADEYSDATISAACHKFNAENRQAMSHSYQLPVTYEGIPAGSWVYVEFEEL